MKQAREALEMATTFSPDEPTPLLRPIPPGESYPTDALGALRGAAAAIHDITQAPPAIAAQSVLGVAALAVQGFADAETLHARAPASLFFLTVAQSGERKSACDRLAKRAVDDLEAELAEIERQERSEWLSRMEVWKAQRAAILKTAPKDPVKARADLSNLGPEPEGPLLPILTMGEPTFEGIAKHLPLLRPAFGLFSDEGGAFLGGHGMNAENRLKTVAGLSGLWDGSPVSRVRAGDGIAKYSGRRLSMHVMAQPVAAAGLLSDPVANGQGFLARFLLTEPVSAIGTRTRLGHSAASENELKRFSEKVAELLRLPFPLAHGQRNELAPPLLPLSNEARKVLQDFSIAVEVAQKAGGDLEAIRPFASKAAEHAARLAAVMTLFADPNARDVTGETMADAVTLAQYYLGEATRLLNASTISQATAEAEALRRWLVDSWGEPFISIRAIVRRGPNALRETKKARAAAQMLESAGWLLPHEGGVVVDSVRAREAWRINKGAGDGFQV